MLDAPKENAPPPAIIEFRKKTVLGNKCMNPSSSPSSFSVRNLPFRRREGRIGGYYLNPMAPMSSGSGFDRRNIDERFKIDVGNRVNAKENATIDRRKVGRTESRACPLRRLSIESTRSFRPSRHSTNLSHLRHRESPKKLPTPPPSVSSCSSADSRSFSSTYYSSSSSSSSSSSNRVRRLGRRQKNGCSSRQKGTLPRHPSTVEKPHCALNSGKEGDSNGGTKKEKGNLRRRIKEKLSFIFHHHHHHHHYNDDNKEEPPPESPKRVGSCKISNKGKLVEVSGERAVKKAHDHGYLHILVNSLINHLWHSSRDKEKQKNTKKVKNTKMVKKKKVDGGRKLHWWQVWKKHGGLNLNSRERRRKKSNLKVGLTKKKK